MDDEAFARFRETRSPSSSASGAEVEENEPSARRRRDGDDEEDDDDDLDEGTSRGDARSGPIEPSLDVGRFETTAEYIGWYLSLDDRNLGEDYVLFCLAECERARAEGRREDEFFYYAELVADDVYWAVKNARLEGARPSRCAGLADVVGRRLTRVMALAAELDSTERSAKAHCLAAMYYCYFHDFSSEEVLEHAGMCLQFARELREEAPDTSETRALGYEIHALRAMRSVSDRSTHQPYAMKSVSGSISDAISLGTKVVMLARREYYHRNITEGLAAESVVIFIEHLIEHALVLRGWREHNGKVVSTPPLERFAADVLKEAKQELENFWTKTSTSWRDDDVLRGQYMFILCHLADLCDNHLDSSHIVVDETQIQSFTAKSERLHRALAVGYRALLSAIDSEIFNPPCVLCRRPLRSTSDSPDDPGFCDDDEPLEFVALSCAGFHHYHRRCRERFASDAYAVADSPLPDVVVDRGLERVSPCRFCARDRAASVEATTSRPFVRFPIPQPSRARAPRSPGRSEAFQTGHTPSF